MTEIGMFEAKTHFSKLARRVRAGEEITVTDRGTPILKMVPVENKRTPEEVRAIIRSFHEDPIEWNGPRLTIEQIIAMKHEGHR